MNAINLQRLRFNMKKFNCINDNLSHKDIEGLVENLKFCQSYKKSILKCKTCSKCLRSLNFQPIKILGRHIVSFDNFMKTSSQTKVNLKYKFYTSSTFLFCTKLCVRAFRMWISWTASRWQNRVAWRHLLWRTTLAALHMFLCRTREVQ